MKPKPGHLGPKYAEQFKDSSVVEVYHHRPAYPDEAIHALLALITDEPRTILDVGCGTGDLARRLASEVERVDAVDFSQVMLEKGRTLPGGESSSPELDVWAPRGCGTSPSLCIHHCGGESSLDGIGGRSSPVSPHPYPSWLSCHR